ncbi:MAG TPA: biopolymer transporter ExbD [Candidatus Binataceae bacterium]|nr:biopolymer transporter ExbD [Candidatus Binataceae bacterium]
MKIRRSRTYRRGRIEIIPMIDVMFFLLVTFMLASLSMQTLNAVNVNLPAGAAQSLESKEPVTLTITQDRKLFVDKLPVTLATLAAALSARLGGQQALIVNADSEAPDGLVVEAMLEAQHAGVQHFQIAVKRQ